MDTSSYKWLVCIDGSHESVLAVHHCAHLLTKLDEVHFIHVLSNPEASSQYKEKVGQYFEKAKQEVLKEASDRITVDNFRFHIVGEGRDAREELLVQAKRLDISFIAMGSKGLTGLKKALLGSVADYVASHSFCPVLITKAERRKPRSEQNNRWLIAFDGSEQSKKAFRTVSLFFKPTDSLHIFYAAPGGDADALKAKLEHTASVILREMKCDVAPQIHISLLQDARISICDLANEVKADYLVLGSRGLKGVKRALLGSVSEYCIRHCGNPVFLFRNQ